MQVVDLQGLRLALRNPLPPNLFIVTGHWLEFGDDAVMLSCQGLSVVEVLKLVCSVLDVPDLLTRMTLPKKRTIICLYVCPGDEEIVQLVQAPYVLHGLRLVLASRAPMAIRCNSVSPRYIEVRLVDEQLVNLLVEQLHAPGELVSYLLKTHDTRNLDELLYIVRQNIPIYERLVADNPNVALSAMKPYFNQSIQCHISPSDGLPSVSDGTFLGLGQISMFILTASFLASYNPVGSDRLVFSSEKKKRRNRRNAATSTSRVDKAPKIPQLQLGPKDFSLDRMLEILKHLRPDDTASSDVYTHISNLAAMKFLAIISTNLNAGRSILDATKLRCLLTFHAAANIANKIGLNLSHYLYDPCS